MDRFPASKPQFSSAKARFVFYKGGMKTPQMHWKNIFRNIMNTLNLVSIVAALFLFGFPARSKAGEPSVPKASAAATKASAKKTPAAATKTAKLAPGEISLFDGKTLKGWRESDFAGKGEVKVEGGKIIMGIGVMTGVTYTNDVPRMNYEVNLEAMRVDGSDFFCALTFPVNKDPCSLIVGGWGGGLIGLSSLDGEDAANNETTQFMNFKNGRWYKIRLRVLPNKIQAWIDGEKLVDVITTDHKIGIRWEVEPSLPFGIATYATTGAVRNIRIRRL